MKNVLETYQLELKVCGPVFIGSGEEIQKKEYMFLGRNKIGVVDVEKLYALAVKKRIASDLEKYMLEDTREDLKHWALRNRVSDKELEPCMRYTVDTGDLQLEKGKKQIMAWHKGSLWESLCSRQFHKRYVENDSALCRNCEESKKIRKRQRADFAGFTEFQCSTKTGSRKKY